MRVSIIRVVGLGIFAWVVFNVIQIVMLALPFTPHGIGLRQMLTLSQQPSLEAGNRAFDQWLLIVRQTQIVDATALPIVTGAAVFGVYRRYALPHLTVMQIVTIALVFGGLGTIHIGFDGFTVVASASLLTTIYVIQAWWGRSASAGSAP